MQIKKLVRKVVELVSLKACRLDLQHLQLVVVGDFCQLPPVTVEGSGEKEFMNENLNTKEDLMDCIELHISYLDDCDYYLIDGSMIDEVYNTLLKREKIKKKINS